MKQKWEYQVIDWQPDTYKLKLEHESEMVRDQIEAALNDLGRDGWELAGVVSAEAATDPSRLFLKRLLEPVLERNEPMERVRQQKRLRPGQ